MAFDNDLPDELQDSPDAPAITPDKVERLAALGVVIAGKRDEAIQARKDSGIEDIWAACEDAYLGIDDSNRHEFAGAKWAKPTSLNGPVTTTAARPDTTKSSAFVRLTPRYVDAGTAKICEILLPINDKPFSFGPTPVPELVTAKEDTSQVIDTDGTPLMRQPKPEEAQPVEPGQPAQTPGPVPLTVKDLAEEKLNIAKTAAEKAEKRVADWLVECNYPGEMRKVIFDSARIGVGLLKGPVPDISRGQSLSRKGNEISIETVESVKPVAQWKDVWNFFPDGACGENIHNGDHTFERDFLTGRKLKDLKKQRGQDGTPIYLSEQIDKVIEEGPGKINLTEGANPNSKPHKNRFEIWYFYGTLTRADMEAAGAVGIEELPDDVVEVHAIATMVNDTVIRATINPLDSGKFPYRVMPWSRRAGHWAGVGVGEQCKLPQSMVNGGTRALLNNGGLSAGIQIIMNQHAIMPADSSWAITPNKLWHVAEGETLDDVRKAFLSVEFPNVGEAMMNIINYAFKLAEEATNIPLITQGQVNGQTPDTFGAVSLQNDNAHSLLRSLAFICDDNVTEPMMKDFYEWLLLDPNVPDDEKGDFQINARGSISMVEKAIQEKTLILLLQAANNPAYGADPKKVFTELLTAKRIDPRKIQYSEDDLVKMQNQPPPEAPQVTVAKINAESRQVTTQANVDASLQKVKADTDRDTVYVQAETQRAQAVAEAAMAKLQLEREIANLNYQVKLMQFAQDEKISLNEAKTRLAETAMKLNVQKELSQQTMAASGDKQRSPPPVITPPTEPDGLAPDGKAFQA